MANRNVPATPSQEELREKVNIKNVKNSEERETDNLNTNADTDSLPTVSSAVAVGCRAASSSRSQTRIPGPTALVPSCSTFHMGSRKYTSILPSTRSSEPSVNDSGIQADSSMADPEPSTMSPTPSHATSCQSDTALKLEEYQTLRELQRVVAEMEAEVALSDKEDRELGQLDAPNDDQTSLGSDVEPGRNPDDLWTSEDKSGPSGEMPASSKAQQDTVANEAEQGSAQKPASDSGQDRDAICPQEEDPLAASKADQESQAIEPGQVSAHKLATDGAQISVENSEQKDPLAEATTNEVFQDHQQMLKKLTQIEEAEPAVDLLEPVPQGSEETFPQIVLEPSTGSVEAALQQAFANVNQVQSPEETVDALNGASVGQTDAINQDLHGEPEAEPEIGDMDLATTSDAALVTQTSRTNSHVDGSVGNDRRLIHLEELLRNANNVELLRRLLNIGAEANIVDSEPDFGTPESSADDKDAETDSVPETSTATCTGTETETSTDEDTELNEDEDGADVISQGFNKATVSLVRRLLSGKMMHLACPILFCGFAAGLIYLSRKA